MYRVLFCLFTIYFLYSEEPPLVVVAIPDELVTVGLKEAIDLGWQDGGSPVALQYIKTDGTSARMRAIAKDMVEKYPAKPLVLFAGWHVYELEAAAQVFGPPEAGKPSRLAISSGATLRVLPPGTVSSAPSLEFETMGAHLYAESMKTKGVVIVYINTPYALDYMNSFVSQALFQKTPILGTFEMPVTDSEESLMQAIEPALNMIKQNTPALLVWVGSAHSLEIISDKVQLLPQGTCIICSDIAGGLHDRFGTVPVVVTIPSIIDNTTTTASVTERLLKTGKFPDNRLAWCVWNGYDGARAVSSLIRIGKKVTRETMAIRVDASIPPAALGSSWFDAKEGRSPYGYFWMINAHDNVIKSADLPAFRARVKGAVFSLPDSAGCVARFGRVSWVGDFPWALERFSWQKIYHNNQTIIKHSAEVLKMSNDEIFSRMEISIPLYLVEGRLHGISSQTLPLDKRMIALDFPYPLSSYIISQK